MRNAYVIGASHTHFGEAWNQSYRDLLTEAGSGAIRDAGITGEEIDEVFVGTMSTGKLLGQEHVAPLLLDGAGLADRHLPATRVEAAGASGGIAFRQAVQAIRSGVADVVVVGGIEKMTDVSDTDQAAIQGSAIDQEWEHFFGATEASLHALLAKQHMRKYGTTREQLAAVAVKNHGHAVHNPLAQFQKAIKLESVLNAPMVADPLTMFDCAPSADGAACVVLCSEELRHNFRNQPIKIGGSGQASDTLGLAGRGDLTAWKATEEAARRAYAEAGISTADVDLAEVHDAYTISEILAIEGLGLVKHGEGGPATEEGRTQAGGDVVVNPSGGLKARGHPAGATGVAQICELTWQLRGKADGRQVKDARIGIAHNVGGTGASAVVNVLEVDR
jgi:acetyl-CoA C-acetyltransferase